MKPKLWAGSDDRRDDRVDELNRAIHAQRVAVRRIELRRRSGGRQERRGTLEVVFDPGLVERSAVRSTRVEEAHAHPSSRERRDRSRELADVVALSLQREVDRRLVARQGEQAGGTGFLASVEKLRVTTGSEVSQSPPSRRSVR